MTSEIFDQRHIEKYEATLNDHNRIVVSKQKELKKFTSEASIAGERLPELR